MHFGIGNSIEHRNLGCNVNLRMYSDARLGTSEFSLLENGHAQVDGCRVDSIKFSMQLKFFCETSGLCHTDHIERKFFKNAIISEIVCLGKYLSIDGLTPKAKVF